MDLLRVLLVAFTITFALASFLPTVAADPVLILTEQNFTDIVSQPGATFVMFYAPWCGFCKEVKPIWDELAAVVANENLGARIAKVNIDSDSGLAARFEVKGVPTLVHITEGSFRVYSGSRTLEPLKTFLTTEWKDQKETKVPAKIPEWHQFQIDVYNKFMLSLDKLEVYATETIHEDPLVAGLVLGMGLALAALLVYILVAKCLSPPSVKPKTD